MNSEPDKSPAPSAAAETTQQRILSTALNLFNRHGVDRVAIYRIAAELGISPGNLTYHFAKKQDLVLALIERLEDESIEVLAMPHTPGAAELSTYITRLFEFMCRYHFFFQYPTLMSADERIASSYVKIMNNAQAASMRRIEDAIKFGDISPIPAPNSPKFVAENMWAVWIHRLGLPRHQNEESNDIRETVYDCCLHHVSLIQPYASSKFIARLHKEIRANLGMDALELEG